MFIQKKKRQGEHGVVEVLMHSSVRCQESLGDGEFKGYQLSPSLTAISDSKKLSPLCIEAGEERLTDSEGGDRVQLSKF